jgi:hypothetical protein
LLILVLAVSKAFVSVAETYDLPQEQLKEFISLVKILLPQEQPLVLLLLESILTNQFFSLCLRASLSSVNLSCSLLILVF